MRKANNAHSEQSTQRDRCPKVERRAGARVPVCLEGQGSYVVGGGMGSLSLWELAGVCHQTDLDNLDKDWEEG